MFSSTFLSVVIISSAFFAPKGESLYPKEAVDQRWKWSDHYFNSYEQNMDSTRKNGISQNIVARKPSETGWLAKIFAILSPAGFRMALSENRKHLWCDIADSLINDKCRGMSNPLNIRVAHAMVNCALQASQVLPVNWDNTSGASENDLILEQVFLPVAEQVCVTFTINVKNELPLDLTEVMDKIQFVNDKLRRLRAHHDHTLDDLIHVRSSLLDSKRNLEDGFASIEEILDKLGDSRGSITREVTHYKEALEKRLSNLSRQFVLGIIDLHDLNNTKLGIYRLVEKEKEREEIREGHKMDVLSNLAGICCVVSIVRIIHDRYSGTVCLLGAAFVAIIMSIYHLQPPVCTSFVDVLLAKQWTNEFAIVFSVFCLGTIILLASMAIKLVRSPVGWRSTSVYSNRTTTPLSHLEFHQLVSNLQSLRNDLGNWKLQKRRIYDRALFFSEPHHPSQRSGSRQAKCILPSSRATPLRASRASAQVERLNTDRTNNGGDPKPVRRSARLKSQRIH